MNGWVSEVVIPNFKELLPSTLQKKIKTCKSGPYHPISTCACIIKILGQGKDAVNWEYLNKFNVMRETLTEGSHENFIYVSIKYYVQEYSNSCVALSSHNLDQDVESFILIILNSTALKNKSFWKKIHITNQPKPTQKIYMLYYWFHSEEIRCRSYIFILWLLDFKTKDYIQGTKVNTSDLSMNIWLLPCTLSEHSSLARSLIICGIKISFSTCLSLELSARVIKTKNREKNFFLSLHQRKSIYRNNTALFI